VPRERPLCQFAHPRPWSAVAVVSLGANESPALAAELAGKPPDGLGQLEHSDSILLLAAVDRAIRHGAGRRAGGRPQTDAAAVPGFIIARHLGYVQGSQAGRLLRSRLDEMEREGWLEIHPRPHPPRWRLTGRGRRALARYGPRASSNLPEAPQHRAWREARAVAEQQIGELRAGFGEAIDQAAALLGANENTDAWLELSARLHDAARRLAGATYCLSEWAEPDDEVADVDPLPGRARLRRWKSWSLPLAPDA
jgi:hypothetical protein